MLFNLSYLFIFVAFSNLQICLLYNDWNFNDFKGFYNESEIVLLVFSKLMEAFYN